MNFLNHRYVSKKDIVHGTDNRLEMSGNIENLKNYIKHCPLPPNRAFLGMGVSRIP